MFVPWYTCICIRRSMTALAGPMSDWGKKECLSVREQAFAAQKWSDGGPQMPPIKVRERH